MKHILFLAHRVPFPPDRGDKIRSFHILRYLAQRATVHLVAFADDPRDLSPPDEFRALLGECVIVPRTKSRARAAVEALASGRPLSLTAFDSPALRAAVEHVMASHRIDAVYAFSGQMAQYLPMGAPRTIMDFVDADSAKFASYAEDRAGPERWMMRREARLLGAYERAVAAKTDAALFVSDAEAALVPRGRALENGIDACLFDPAVQVSLPNVEGRLIVFTGQMDYRPNIDAVAWFAGKVMPSLPEVRFAIVGRAPTAEVRALASDSVIVTGEVVDVRGWLARADTVVAPLKLARGVQNKVLEAMAMARPVVASAAAAEGIDHDGTIRVAQDANAFVTELTALLGDRTTATVLGASARARVIARYDWDARLAPLDALLGFEPRTQVAA